MPLLLLEGMRSEVGIAQGFVKPTLVWRLLSQPPVADARRARTVGPHIRMLGDNNKVKGSGGDRIRVACIAEANTTIMAR